MSDNIYLKYDGFEGNPNFQIRLNPMGTKDCDFELSCKCKFRVPDIPLRDATCEGTLIEDIYQGLPIFLASLYKGEVVQKEESLWNDPDFKPAKHLFCPKDQEQVRHVKEFVEQRRAMLMESGGKEMENCNCCLYGNDTLQTMMHLIIFRSTVQGSSHSSTSRDLVSATKTARKGPRLPKSVKKVLQKAHKDLEAATKPYTSDEKMAELFKETVGVKPQKKLIKKKPNQGKAPNNIRKTKKPARL